MALIYIASPYTIGDQALNVRRQVEAADELEKRGHIAYIPCLSHLRQLISPKSYEEWLRIGMAWLGYCDAVLRLSGESKGADREIAQAKEWCMPIYYLVEEIPDVSSLPSMRRSPL